MVNSATRRARSSPARTATTSRRWPSCAWTSCGSRARSSASRTWSCSGTTTRACPSGSTAPGPDAFCNIPLEDVAARITALIERYRPQVVVSYDPMGAYQHPDHVHAARAAAAAVDASPIPAKFYQIAMRRSGWRKIRDAMIAAGEDVERVGRDPPRTGRRWSWRSSASPRRSTSRDVLALKREALLSHASQIADSWFSKIPPDIAAEVFGQETFIRVTDRTGAPVPEDDLFAGLRADPRRPPARALSSGRTRCARRRAGRAGQIGPGGSRRSAAG